MKRNCYFCGEKVSMVDFATAKVPERKTSVVCHTECFMENKNKTECQQCGKKQDKVICDECTDYNNDEYARMGVAQD